MNTLSQISSEISFVEGSAYRVGGFILLLHYSANSYSVTIQHSVYTRSGRGREGETKSPISKENAKGQRKKTLQETRWKYLA